jgi:hypothetical protein
LGVSAAGLQAVYDNRTTAGVKQPLRYTPNANADLLPAGSSYGGNRAILVAPFTLANWDFTGVWVDQIGTGDGVYDQCKFGGDVPLPFQLAFSLNKESGTSRAICNNCTMDGTGLGDNFDGMFDLYAGQFVDNNCLWMNSCQNFVTNVSSVGPHNFNDGYMSLPATNGQGGSGLHIQSLHNFVGVVNFDGYLIDWGPPSIASEFVGGPLGPLYAEDVSGASTINLTNCIVSLTGSPVTKDFPPGSGASGHVYWPLRAAGVTYTATIKVTGCAIQVGAQAEGGGYALGGGGNGFIVDGGGNYDYDTGAPINVTSP